MNNRTIIFDFDGTIGDTLAMGITIYNKIAPTYQCKKVELADVSTLQVKRPQEIMSDYNITYFKIPFLLMKIKKELSKQVGDIQPFPGMIDALQTLHQSGCTLGILTSNSRENVNAFLELHNISHLFDFVYSGKHFFGKEKTMRKVLKRENIPIDSVIYVGDETRDIVASQKAGIPIISVTWGFNLRSALEKIEPDYLVDTAGELRQIIKTM